jgi:hypothetical protein
MKGQDMPAGRPTDYNQEIAEKIIDQLADGKPMKVICKQEDMPCYMSVLRWQRRHPEFGDLVARAKIDGTHALADECIDIADDDKLDPADKRVRVDTRIRLIGKWNASVYGDRVAVGGSEDMPPIKTSTQLDVSSLSLEELEVLGAALQKSIGKD